jgi:hypothetical protein
LVSWSARKFDVLGQVAGLLCEREVGAVGLLLGILDCRGQQAAEAEIVALSIGERRSAVA